MVSQDTLKRREEDLVVDLNYKILYEDEDLAVIDKPSPLPVHPVGRFTTKTLLSLLKKRWPTVPSLHLVNRLDSETSGLVLVAKNKDSAGKLGIQIENRKIHKEYHAIIFGIPKEPKGTIKMALGYKVERSYRLRIPDPLGQSCETVYECLESHGNFSLLKLTPGTGRMHQLRAHMAYSGHPIVGDKVYIDLEIFDRYVQEGWQEDMLKTVKLPRLALHASFMRFRHPVQHREVEFHSPPPQIFKDFMVSHFEKNYNKAITLG